jgi:hypothetical protein
VEPELGTLDSAQPAEQHQRIARPCGHALPHALVFASFGHLRAVRVAEHHPYPHAGACLGGEDLLHGRFLSKEDPGVDE